MAKRNEMSKGSIPSKTIKAVDTAERTAHNAALGVQGLSAQAETGRTALRAKRVYNRTKFEDQKSVGPEYKWR